MIYAKAVDEAVSIHHSSTLPMIPGLHYTWYTTTVAGQLELNLTPVGLITWQMWILVLNGLKHFMMSFEYVELDFDVEFIHTGPVAHGSIKVA